jgi:hypothetical protein
MQIKKHYDSHPQKVEVKLEKLQQVAIALVEPKYKVRWLWWWNSSAMARDAYGFSKNPASENKLKPWLDKAAFWACVSF